MKPQSKIAAATALIVVPLLGGVDYLLERLGYFSTIALIVPQSWLNSMRTEPYLLIGCAVLFAIAVGLLWSVAIQTSKAMKSYNASNQRAWAFDAEFTALREDYQAVRAQYDEITRLLTANNEKLDRLETERENSLTEIAEINSAVIANAAQSVKKAAEEEMAAARGLIEELKGVAADGRRHVDELAEEATKRLEQVMENVAAREKVESEEWRRTVAAELVERLKQIEEASKK